VDSERAETYLRVRAERELLRLKGRPTVSQIQASAGHLRRAGDILVEAGLLRPELADAITEELRAALSVRSNADAPWLMHTLEEAARALADAHTPENVPSAGKTRSRGKAASPASAGGAASADGADGARTRDETRPMRVVPIGQAIHVPAERAPADLYLMALVGLPHCAVITAGMRMRWPADGSSTDLEITGAGPQHLPYAQLAGLDDAGNRYRFDFRGGDSGTATWYGVIYVTPALPQTAKWLDLVAEGTEHIARLHLRQPRPQVRTTIIETVTTPPGERLLAAATDRLLATAGGIPDPVAAERLGELATVLTGAGAVAADSATPAQIAEVCHQLGLRAPVVDGAVRSAAAAELPEHWASVLAQTRTDRVQLARRQPEPPDDRPYEEFIPLTALLPETDGTRFALAGVSTTETGTVLHMVAAGLPDRLGRDIGFSWWLTDSLGHWHLATASDLDRHDPGCAMFRLHVKPALSAPPAEFVVTGPATRVRLTLTEPAAGHADSTG
jgi:hypothetical protein